MLEVGDRRVHYPPDAGLGAGVVSSLSLPRLLRSILLVSP
jgi:hypothetical protein